MSTANKLVFDIETIGNDFDSLDEISQKYLLKYAQDEDEEAQIKEGTAFYPLTGQIVVIGMLNPETNKGKILVSGKNLELPNILEDGISIEQGSEREILQEFWKTVKKYDIFITFYGRGFDVPFLMIRSAILGVKPSKNLLSNRYLNSQPQNAKHIDLADQLSFYGAARKNFPLHMWSKSFGIESSKEGGVTGDDVTLLYKEGKILDIVKYNLRDLKSTAELYRKWDYYLNI
jgi:predicted PolB exonuclease-like 3'-5' exonuclease